MFFRQASLSLKGILISAALIFFFSCGADGRKAEVDRLLARWDKPSSPGVALAIIQDGRILYERGYGMANLEYNIPITPSTVFRIGSTSKQFTAAAIAMLALEGKISLDDDIRKYIPEIPAYGKPITIQHLIHHTSGLRDYTMLLPLAGYRPDGDCPPVEETIEILSRQKNLNFLPGEKFSYSNSGYFLLAVIVERVTGKSLDEFARERIFGPLGMKNTHFHDDHTKLVPHRADGYSPTKNGFRLDMSNWNHVGDGGLFTTVEDLFLWDQAFYNHQLGRELIDLLQTPGRLDNGQELDYAFGLVIGEYRGLKTVGHGGSWVGFRSAILRFPEQKFSVICLANLSTINPSQLCRQIADIYLADYFKEEKAKEPEKKTWVRPFPLKDSELQEKAGNYHNKELGVWAIISVADKKLALEWEGRKFLLVPVSRTTFKTTGGRMTLTLEFLPEVRHEKRVKLTREWRSLKGEQEEIILVKAREIASLKLEQLKEYEGEYYSPEIMAIYRLAVREGALVFTQKNGPQDALRPVAPDEFIAGWLTIKFIRKTNKEIAGFNLRAGQTNLEFKKLSLIR